ncbi:hypothetical protein [Mucilaginibacter sp. UYCu711]|uniref:hypothetical protein n=1 Tax=Mucilaginibacter sp. UYCu711 TaxID=3156339 RepID=UPI003D2311E1
MNVTAVHNILLIDDNPYPTVECVKVLSEKLQRHFEKPISDFKLKTANELTAGETTKISFSDDNCSLYFYFYNVNHDRATNNKIILKILIENNINVLWMDRGHSAFIVDNDNLYETNGYTSKSEEIFDDKTIVKQLIKNKIQQIAIYSFNPLLREDVIDNIKETIAKKISDCDNKSKKKIKDIHSKIDFLETSPILNLYNKKLTLSAGADQDNYLGHISAYEKYGKLLGQILFDLFLQLPDYKITLSNKAKQYNFFNKNNRQILRYIKFLNDLNEKEDKNENKFKIGLVSFSTNAFGTKNFLLDAPYKDYYEQYDNFLEERKILENVFNPKSDKRFIHYQYFVCNENTIKYLVRHNLDTLNDDHIIAFLPLLHTGIFYEPDPDSNKPKTFGIEKKSSSEKFPNDAVEIFYLLNCVKVENLEGLLHIAFWRRTAMLNTKPENTVTEFWRTEYKLIEPKAKETLIPILFSQINRQATRAAVSQVNARTTSHNTGSHILANDIEVEKFKDLSEFKYYLRQRMLYNADLTSNISNAFAPATFGNVLSSFQKLEIVKKYISGLENKRFNSFNVSNAIKKIIIAIPNDSLGYQAFYIIFENLIRNYFKHGKKTGALYQNNKLNIAIKQLDFDSLYYYCFEISDGSLINQNIYGRIQKLIADPILSNESLRKEGLGYIEIKAALCYLNNIPLHCIDNPNLNELGNLPIFTVQPITTTDKTLRYKFFIKKPFFLKLSKSDVLNIDFLKQGIVDSKNPTEFDTLCGFYSGDDIEDKDKALLTPRTISDSDDLGTNKSIETLIDLFYDKWISPKKFSIYKINFKDASNELNFDRINYSAGPDNLFEIVENSTIDHQSFSLFFDDHSLRLDKVLALKKGLNSVFYEDYKSDVAAGKIIRDFTIQKKPYLLKQFYEAAKTNIVVVDERIQRFGDKYYKDVNSNYNSCSPQSKLTTREVLELSYIFVPHKKDLNLNVENFNEDFKIKIKNYLTKALKDDFFNFIVIHLGIIEKLTIDKSSLSISNIISKIIPNGFANDRVIIISERGTPDNIEPYYRFLHYSNIAKHIIEEKSKLHLVNAIFDSRALK